MSPQRASAGQPLWLSGLVMLVAGLMLSLGAAASRGTDLRPDRTDNLRELVVAQSRRNQQLRGEAEQLQTQVSELSEEQAVGSIADEVSEAELGASVPAVSGPGVRVILSDAPTDVSPPGASDDDLIVHQQDIQAVANALWSGGAEAMAIQGQRMISTTGIKCVGNSVVLHGVPYAPPYVVEAIGDPQSLQAAVESAAAVDIYRQYVEAYGLGFEMQVSDQLELPSFAGTTGIEFAELG